MYMLGCCEEQFYGDHAHAGRTKYDFPLQIWVKMLKNRGKCKNRRIQPKYRADNFVNGFSVFLVPENPIFATKIFALSAIGAKLAGPPMTNGRHLGFWALDPPMDSFFSWEHVLNQTI